MPGIKRLLVVCTGNSCRSVMAKGLLKKLLESRKDVEIASAGTAAMPGFRPTQETIEIMARHGIDVSGHLSQRLTPDMVDRADLVLVMERGHQEEILKKIPRAKKKVFLLREYADTAPSSPTMDIEIPDPIAKPIEVYESCFRAIQEAIERVVKKL
ncbi:MAG: low molecular weight protein arginine phosphatase [Candidatus Omnitrophica bacterium]|nr:low molecular weight protein arginine phosphatase [Candidatus Omnitrophota bacterium]